MPETFPAEHHGLRKGAGFYPSVERVHGHADHVRGGVGIEPVRRVEAFAAHVMGTIGSAMFRPGTKQFGRLGGLPRLSPAP